MTAKRVQAGLIPAELAERIQTQAARRGVGRHKMIEVALVEAVEFWEAQDVEGLMAGWRAARGMKA